MSALSALATARRAAARAEVSRVAVARAERLATLLRAGVSTDEIEQVRGHAGSLGDALSAAWAAFIESPLDAQIEALGRPAFGGMPWHSLLQCNPYGRLARWKPVALRAYSRGVRP